MPFRPEEIVIHEEVAEVYQSWEALASQHRQPAQSVWKSLQVAITRLRADAQWGELVRQAAISPYFRARYGVSNLIAWTSRCSIDASTL